MDEGGTGPVVCVGMVTLDVVHVVERVPRANEKVPELDQSWTVGGPAANAALTAAALGAPVDLVAGFGRCPLTPVVAATLEGGGVRWHDPAAEVPSPSPVSTILVTRGTGERAVVGGAAPALAPDVALPAGLVERAAAVLLDGHALPLAREAAGRARRRGIPVVLDGGSYKTGTEELLADVDVAILSADFIPPDGSNALTWVRARGARFAARSRGPLPLEVEDDRGRRLVPVPEVDVVDTLGAGDVLHGAAAFALARCGLVDVERALRFAGAVASLSCRYPGALGWAARADGRERARLLSTGFVHSCVDDEEAGAQP